MPQEEQIRVKSVYYVESLQTPDMNPLAITVEFTPPDYIAWEDTVHGRIIRFSKVLFDDKEIDFTKQKTVKIPEKIEITSKNGETYLLVKLTKNLFDEKLKNRVELGTSLNFNSDKEVQEYYLKTDFYNIGY